MLVQKFLNIKYCISLLLLLFISLSVKADKVSDKNSTQNRFKYKENYYLSKAKDLIRSNRDSAAFLLQVAEKEARKEGNEEYVFWVQILKNRLFSAYNETDKAQAVLDKLYQESITQRDTICYAYWLNEKGHLFMDEYEWEKAISFYLQALDFFQRNKMDIEVSNIYSNVITYFVKIKDYKTAAFYTRKKLNFSLTSGLEKHIVRAYEDIGYVAFFTEEYDTAAVYYSKAFEKSKNISSKYTRNSYLQSAGDAYVYAGQKRKGLKIIEDLKPYYDSISNRALPYFFFNMNYGNALIENNKLDSGLAYLKKADNIAQENDYTEYKGYIYEKYYRLYKLTGDFKKALVYFEKKDSVETLVQDAIDEERLIKVSRMFDTNVKQHTIKILTEENTKTKEQIERDKYVQLYLLFAILFIAVIAGFIWLRSKERAKNQIWLEKQVAQRTEELRDKNEEARLLLTEIHHRVKNNLQLISSFLNLQRHFLKGKNTEDILQETVNRVQCMALIHEKLYSTNEVGKVLFGEYIKDITQQLKMSLNPAGVRINVKYHFDDYLMPVERLIPCGIITNEVVTNIFKYAFEGMEEGNIKIVFSVDDTKTTYVIEDNGVGIPDGLDPTDSDSLGMTIIDGLVGQLDGTWKVENITPSGTKYIIQLPIKG